MIWLLWVVLTLPLRVASRIVRLVVGTIRFVGLGRLAAFGTGVAVATSMSPERQAEIRRRLQQSTGTAAQLVGSAVAPSERAAGSATGPTSATETALVAEVRVALADGPRTWHLAQPVVTATEGKVTLRGEAPHDEARLALVRAAGAVAGVRAVDDRIDVVDTTMDEGMSGGDDG